MRLKSSEEAARTGYGICTVEPPECGAARGLGTVRGALEPTVPNTNGRRERRPRGAGAGALGLNTWLPPLSRVTYAPLALLCRPGRLGNPSLRLAAAGCALARAELA